MTYHLTCEKHTTSSVDVQILLSQHSYCPDCAIEFLAAEVRRLREDKVICDFTSEDYVNMLKRAEAAEAEVRRLQEVLGELSEANPYYVSCPSCGQRWATSLGSKFECLCCGEQIHAKPELKIVE